MGLFTKKDPCAICGGKVKGLLAWKVEGKYVCDDCYGRVDLPGKGTNDMTLEQFEEYRAFRAENDKLKEGFQKSQEIDFGAFETKIVFDSANKLFCMDKNLKTTVFEGHHIKKFEIREDEFVLLEGSAEGLYRHRSMVRAHVRAMAPQISQFIMQARLRESMEDMREAMGKDRPLYTPQPDLPGPFNSFNIEIQLDHPYWSCLTADMSAPAFDNDRPDIEDYLSTYDEKIALMEQLALALMDIAYPDAPIDMSGNVDDLEPVTSNASAGVSVADEIKKFKELLDMGVLTEEEFTAKKKQLLGI